jgi:hypothetical protein
MNFRLTHMVIGLLATLAFVLTGQAIHHHHPPVLLVSAEVRLMLVSRHIYLLGAALVNLVLGMYLRERSGGWRLYLQRLGSSLIVMAPVLLLLAFCWEPEHGMAGRGWRSLLGLFSLFGGVVLHCTSALFSVKSSELN